VYRLIVEKVRRERPLDFGGYDDENSEFMFQNSLGKVF